MYAGRYVMKTTNLFFSRGEMDPSILNLGSMIQPLQLTSLFLTGFDQQRAWVRAQAPRILL